MNSPFFRSSGTQSPSELTERLAQHNCNYSLEQAFYSSNEGFDLDMREVFEKEWLFAGVTADIPNTGNYFTLNIGPNPIVVVRDQQGQVRAFHNVCRHRGSRICMESKGKTAKLVCPYHQWTFELDGSLIFAGTEMGENFELKDHSLKAVHARAAGGYIYICLGETPPPFDEYLTDLATYLEPYDLDNTKVAVESNIVEKANWKLVIENNRECYHCNGSHPELLNTLLEWDDTNDPRASADFLAQVEAATKLWEAENIPHAHVSHANGRNRLVRMPLRQGTVAMTIDGSRACKLTMGRIKNPDLGSLRILHLPNSWSHAQGDHLIAFRVLPLGPQETLVTTKWLVHKDAVEGVDYDPDNLRKVWDATNQQDRLLAERNQEGVNSIAYEPGPYSPTFEFGVINFINWYIDVVLANSGCERTAIDDKTL